MATLLQMLKSVVTRFQIPSHQYMSIGEGFNEKTSSRLERVWKHGKVHIFYIFLMITLVVLNRHASLPLHQQTLYWEEPVRSEIRCKSMIKMFFRHIEKNGPLSDRITDVEVVKNKPRIFDLDEDYAMPPSTSVNNAWSSLIPEEGGFFEHPAITSGVSCFAVFHQIHCLDMLRLALYELHPDTKGNRQNSSHATTHQKHNGADSTTDVNSSYDIYHVGHCFDLLRQAIMCRPVSLPYNLHWVLWNPLNFERLTVLHVKDLTVETLEPKFGGVTGFGTKHQCVDWQELMNWMAINESH